MSLDVVLIATATTFTTCNNDHCCYFDYCYIVITIIMIITIVIATVIAGCGMMWGMTKLVSNGGSRGSLLMQCRMARQIIKACNKQVLIMILIYAKHARRYKPACLLSSSTLISSRLTLNTLH